MNYSFTVIRAPLGQDLRVFSEFLWQQNIPHQISEASGVQVVMVENEAVAGGVHEYYSQWRNGTLDLSLAPSAAVVRKGTEVKLKALITTPFTLSLIVASLLGFLLFMADPTLDWMSQLTFVGFEVEETRLIFSKGDRELWRNLTPIFLHFSWLHVVFNSLWIWEIGGRIERQLGTLMLLGLVVVCAVISNAVQFWMTGPSLFGGMSGVVYALLGFCWVAGNLRPEWGVGLPMPMVMLMVGWLLLCMSGLIEILGFGAIANGAHLGGLVVGCVLGLFFGLFGKGRSGEVY